MATSNCLLNETVNEEGLLFVLDIICEEQQRERMNHRGVVQKDLVCADGLMIDKISRIERLARGIDGSLMELCWTPIRCE